MGTRLYYSFHGSELEDAHRFEAVVDQLAREIGDRGRSATSAALSGNRPSQRANPAAASSTQSALVAPASAPRHTATPPAPMSGVSSTRRAPPPRTANTPSQFSELMSLTRLVARLEAKIDKQGEEIEQLRKEATDARMHAAAEQAHGASDQQLVALQARFAAAYAAKLLSWAQFLAFENLCADFLELRAASISTGTEFDLMFKLRNLIILSESMTNDESFARQATRKYVPDVPAGPPPLPR
eukprot:COSAG01_NODE_8391_length_2804_cov_2.002957_1_plen_242_part_00